MSEHNGCYAVGYRTPPKHRQFRKGQSGNPKGRPKGSLNTSTVLQKVARQRVKVTSDGVSRSVSKLEAAATQLSNQAAQGDPRAIREFLSLLRLCEEPAQTNPAQAGSQEIDRKVMGNILKRILQSEKSPSEDEMGSETKATNPPQEVE